MDEPKIVLPNPPRSTYCWLHSDRLCSGDCEAFDPFAAQDEQGKRTACRLVNSLESLGKAFVTMARSGKKMPGSELNPPKVT